jgi:AraC-like DNA-binding protein
VTGAAGSIDLARPIDAYDPPMLTGSTQNLRFITAAAAAMGISPPQLLAELGLEPSVVAEPDGRLPPLVLVRAWNVAAELTRDPDFGLHAAQRLHGPDFGALGYVVRSCPTVGQAYQRLARYFRVVNQAAALELLADGDGPHVHLRLRLTSADVAALRQPVECLVAVLLECARRCCARPVPATAVRFRHAAPPRLREHERVLGVVPLFAQPVDELVLDAALLQEPNRMADPLLLPILEEQVQKHAETLSPDGAVVERVQKVLRGLLQQGEPTVEQVAGALRLSVRTLQRRLQRQGTSLQALLDELRHDLALRQLRNPQLSIAEIAFELGFSEVSAFHRAFKRWTGRTPGELRPRPHK